MVSVLVISYHYLPLNVIASYRSKAIIDHFYENGIFPTLITQNWEDLSAEKIEETDRYRIIRLSQTFDEQKSESNNFFVSLLMRIRLVINWAMGFFDDFPGASSSYSDYKRFLTHHLKRNKYDLILSIYSPHHHLKLAHMLGKRYKIPYILDFRDLWDNRITGHNFSPSIALRVKYFFIKRYWRKWLKRSLFFVTISDPWVSFLKKISGKDGYRITHGFEEELRNIKPVSNSVFSMVYTGTVNQVQDIDMLGRALSLFVNNRENIRFKISFFGSKKSGKQKQFIDPEPILLKYISASQLEVTERISRDVLKEKWAASNLLLLPTYRGFEGTYSGKVFEYLGLKKNIVVFPDDMSVIGELIRETKAGVVLNNEHEIYRYLSDKYDEWLSFGECSYEGRNSKIEIYSRKNQTSLLAKLIHQAW